MISPNPRIENPKPPQAPGGTSAAAGTARRPKAGKARLVAPTALVVVWSSGFISGSLGLRHAAPYTFATLRFALAGLVLLAVAGLRRKTFPRGRELWHLAVAGTLVQAVQFSSIYMGMDLGVPSGLAALVIALYPLTASLLAVPMLRERVSAGQCAGLVLGLGGVALAVSDGIQLSGGYLLGLGFLALGLLGISVGTVYQKRFCGQVDPVGGNAVQLLAAAAVTLVPALLHEGWEVEFTAGYWPVLLWSALINSIVGVGLLYHLLQRNGTSQVSSLFYLVPMCTAGLAAVLLGQPLGLSTLGGLALATAGAFLAHRVRR
ncbi:DMT family transporter [Streptomyces sp. NPDC054863]